MKTAAAVAAGGAAGALARYGLSAAIGPAAAGAFPLATFIANVSGSLLLGALLGAASAIRIPISLREGLGTGVFGGYTTFSAFSVETVLLLKDGHAAAGLLYAAASIVLGCAAAQAGYAAVRRIVVRRDSRGGEVPR